MSAPSPEAQVEFLGNLQRLLDEGQFVATYKYALLTALSDLSVELGNDSGDPLPVEVDRIAEKFIEYYWRQVRPYRGDVLHQNTGQQAGILRHLIDAQDNFGPKLSGFRKHGAQYEGLRWQVARVVREMPLWKLQTVAGSTLPFLYEAPEIRGTIVLKPGVAYCFRAFHGLIRRLLRTEWLGYIRGHRANLSIVGDTHDLDAFLFGSEREGLEDLAEILEAIQHRECFYCRSRVQGEIDIDHFIPWSRYPVDLGHNFVMAHRRCNQAKRDHLAAPVHLERWIARNDRHRNELEEGFRDRLTVC